MKNCKYSLLLIALLLALLPGMRALASSSALPAAVRAGQSAHIVSGTVTDQDGQPVPGAAIMIQGTTTGTVSDADGRYTLSDVPSDATLVCSFVGYTTASVPVNGQSNVNIVLTDDTKFLEDVVVIGYGTQRKGDVTSAVVSVKAEDFTQAPSADAMDLVKGKVAGLNISKGSGDPNATSSIRLRGVISLEGANTPLVLIDGIEGGLNTVAPENIESIDVLKDASAAAIYGTRGANGVILITTKTGKREEEASVTYSFYGTWSKMGKTLDMMDADDIRAGKTSFTDRGYETDWMDAISQTAFTQNHDFNITGGSKKTTYSANFNYRKALGTIIDTWGQDIKLNMDVAHWFFDDILKAHFNIVYRNHRNSAVGLSGGGDANIYLQAVMRNPTEPIYENQDRPEYNDDGTYIQNEERPYYENFGKLYYWNPVGMIKEHKGGYRSNNTRLTGDLTAEPIKGWQTKFLYSRVQGGSHDNGYYTSKYYSLRSESKTGSASHGYGEGMTDLIEITTKYANTFGKHRVEGLVGYSWQRDKNWGFNANNYNFPTDEFEANNLGLGTALKDGKAGMGSYKNDETLIGIFARLSYGWNDRYNVLVSLRHEGSSKFGADEKWGNFPSVSLGWNISNEGFMQGQNVVSNLKLRIDMGARA